MGGIPIVKVDNNVKEIIFNLFKLIIGNACTSFYENGVSTRATSHCMIEGENINYTSFAKKNTIINYKIPLENMNMILILDVDGKEQN